MSPSTPSAFARRVFAVALGLSLVVIVIAILLGLYKYPDRPAPAHYFDEGKFPTGLSIALLVVTGVFLFFSYRHRRGAGARFGTGAAIWLAGAIGFLFLAFDEGFQIHENIDFWLHRTVITGGETALTDRIDDLIILVYGLVGATVLLICRREVFQFRGAWPWVLLAAIAGTASVGLDFLTNGKDLVQGSLHDWASVAEDSAKLFAEAGFVAAAAFVFRAAGAERAD